MRRFIVEGENSQRHLERSILNMAMGDRLGEAREEEKREGAKTISGYPETRGPLAKMAEVIEGSEAGEKKPSPWAGEFSGVRSAGRSHGF